MAQQINLFNPVFLKQKKYFSAVTMLQALGLLLAGILAFYGYVRYESVALRRVADGASKQLAAQTEQVSRLTKDFSPAGRSKLLEEETTRMAARLKQREELLGILLTGGLGNAQGFARYLAAFARQAMGGVWLTGLTIAGDENDLLVSGRVLYADLVPQYIRALNKEEVMRGRRVAELRLTAREESRADDTAAPGANPASARRPAAPTTMRYVEFSVVASRGAAGAGADGNAPAATSPRSPASAAAAQTVSGVAAALKEAK